MLQLLGWLHVLQLLGWLHVLHEFDFWHGLQLLQPARTTPRIATDKTVTIRRIDASCVGCTQTREARDASRPPKADHLTQSVRRIHVSVTGEGTIARGGS